MTDNLKDAEYLVRVKAQVMTRDDSTGGWVPMGGGGVSIVGLRKRVHPSAQQDDMRHEYLINGQRMSDNSVVLNCALKKDVQYTKANPTFHHWKTEEKRFGLTFQTHADARAFDKGVKRAVEDLLEGSGSQHTTTTTGDDDVFMTLDLPLGRKDSSSQSASTASTTTSSPTAQSPSLSPTLLPAEAFSGTGHGFTGPGGGGSLNHHNSGHLHRVHYITRVPSSASSAGNNNNSKIQLSQTPPPPLPLPLASTPTPPQSEIIGTRSKVDSNGRSVVSADEIWVKAADSSKYGGGGGLGPHGHHHPHHAHFHPLDAFSTPMHDDIVDMGADYSYVEFARSRPSVHEYSYPTLDSVPTSGSSGKSPRRYHQQLGGSSGSGVSRRDSIEEIKRHNNWGGSVGSGADSAVLHTNSTSTTTTTSSSSHHQQPPLPTKKKKRDRGVKASIMLKKSGDKSASGKDKRQSGHLLGRQRARCVYCHDSFLLDENTRGSCEDAPDRVIQGIERVTCICAARGMLYHCMADQDGNYGAHPCVCAGGADDQTTVAQSCRKWTALTLLACFVPCLWCYWPLMACHRCGAACGCCGARHKAA